MPRHGGRHVVLLKGAEEAMNAFKMEIATDLGMGDKLSTEGEDAFKNFTTIEVGTIGGEMVRRLQALGEYTVKQRFDKKEQRLIPKDLLPADKDLRAMSNNGNVQPSAGSKLSVPVVVNTVGNASPANSGAVSEANRPLNMVK